MKKKTQKTTIKSPFLEDGLLHFSHPSEYNHQKTKIHPHSTFFYQETKAVQNKTPKSLFLADGC